MVGLEKWWLLEWLYIVGRAWKFLDYRLWPLWRQLEEETRKFRTSGRFLPPSVRTPTSNVSRRQTGVGHLDAGDLASRLVLQNLFRFVRISQIISVRSLYQTPLWKKFIPEFGSIEAYFWNSEQNGVIWQDGANFSNLSKFCKAP